MEDIEVSLSVEDIYEKKAVKELKDMLSCRFKNDEQPVSLWGIPLVTKTTTTPAAQDAILLKFLKAREFSVQDSYNMLINCLSWRKDYFGQVDILEQEFPEFKQLENLATYIHGVDRQGHPVYYNDYSILINNPHLNDEMLGTDENIHKFNKWRLQVLERGIRMHPGRINSIVLVEDFTYYHLTDELMDADDLFYKILLDNYPGMVSYKICVNEPWYILMYFSIEKLFFTYTEDSEGKLVIAKRGQVFETLCKYIKPDSLPIQYGGELNKHENSEGGMWNILQSLSPQAWPLWWRSQGR